MPKSSKIFLAIVFVLGILLVVGLTFIWLSSSKFRVTTSQLSKTVVGEVQLSIEDQSNDFQMYVEDQKRGEKALDLLNNELAVNNISQIQLIITDEIQPNQTKYEGRDYFYSTSYSVTGSTLTVFLNVNPTEFSAMEREYEWNHQILSETLEMLFYKSIYQSARATQRETGEDTSSSLAQDLIQQLNQEYDGRLLTVF